MHAFLSYRRFVKETVRPSRARQTDIALTHLSSAENHHLAPLADSFAAGTLAVSHLTRWTLVGREPRLHRETEASGAGGGEYEIEDGDVGRRDADVRGVRRFHAAACSCAE